ncbi:MAG: histidine kinase [Chloroflexota bacterium]
MIATTEEFHPYLYTAADQDRASVEKLHDAPGHARPRDAARVGGVARCRGPRAARHRRPVRGGGALVLEAARASINGPRPEQAAKMLDEAQDRMLTTIKEIRAVLNNLVPPGLEELGLTKALQRYVEEFVPDAITGEVSGELPRAAYWLEAIFAMTAEAISNAVSMGGPRTSRSICAPRAGAASSP